MANYYYRYSVYEKNGLEYTLIKWFENNIYGPAKKIDKPTSEFSQDDSAIMQDFIDGGMIVKDKSEVPLPDDQITYGMV